MAGFEEITTRTDVDALIPEPVRNDIIKGLPAQSAALTLMRRVTMSSKKERQPVMSALPNAYWVEGDTGLKQTTKAEWENQYLEAEELAVLLPIPDAVVDDADFDVWAEIRPYIIEALGAKIDEATLFGVDAPPSFPDSIVDGAIAASNTTTNGDGDDVAADVNTLLGQIETRFNVTGFAARGAFKGQLRGLRDANGGLLFNPSMQADTPSTLYATPIVYPDGNGAWEDRGVDLIGGDWSKAVLGIRQDITFRMFTEGVISDDDGKVILNLMQQDSSVMRVVMRLGFAVANPISRRGGDGYPFGVLENDLGS